MATMSIRCPHCEREMTLDRAFAGREISCPACNKSFAIPPPTEQLPRAYMVASSSELSYAGFWKPFAALLIDYAILFIPIFVVAFMVVLIFALSTGETEDEVLEGLGQLVGVVGVWLYFAVFESSGRQATPGKMALGIKVVDVDGRRISFGRATGRHFGKIVSSLILGIGFIMAGLTSRKQALHDMMANCLVIRKEPAA